MTLGQIQRRYAKSNLELVERREFSQQHASMIHKSQDSSSYQNLPSSYSLLSDPLYVNCSQLHSIRHDLDCGCWAFAIAEAVGDRFCVVTQARINHVMSPQWLISCDKNDGGCENGAFDTGLQFVEQVGLVTESCVPFQANDNMACPSYCTSNGQLISSTFKTTNSRLFNVTDMESVQTSILKSGSIIAGMKVYRDFLNYKSGVYHHVAGPWLFNVGVKIVGWGVQPGTGVPYWIAANSWSSDWGMNGYFFIARNQNECELEMNMWETTPLLN
ncbi:hypothetical protein C9374_012414 [Naegleria lovaniensis]|uniref:Peptidase C1A papain C-terminal domain-containing protein n=1 Tax=Naegleria lovaniensis TaxID=51637 RepID=A0AA88H2X5_NAELO|nr:uncharacterized protein C9374_012414 [Naegleria lovaniensis]KAG2392162.1 hypothetical protein C9374_012414 [Naegleria lovaniensis]